MTAVKNSWYLHTSLITLCGGEVITVNKNPKYRPHTRDWLMPPDGTPMDTFFRALRIEEDWKNAEAIKFKNSL